MSASTNNLATPTAFGRPRSSLIRTVGVALLICLALPAASHACTCAWSGPFLTVAPRTELVVRAYVLRHAVRRNGIDLAMDVDVREVLRGRLTRRGQLRIWGDNGAQCRPYVSGFPPGTEWLFALTPATLGQERPGDYMLSVCGEFWARVSGYVVTGRLTSPRPPSTTDDARERMTLDEVRRRLKEAAR